MDFKKKIAEIIPPNDRAHRGEFTNHDIINKLTDGEKKEIEEALITKLYSTPNDILIVETLSYLKSEKAIPVLKKSLENCKIELQKIIIALSIYKLNQSNEMIRLALSSLKNINNNTDLWFVFSYLKEFNNEEINEEIKKYVNHQDFLVSHNAKRALGLIKD